MGQKILRTLVFFCLLAATAAAQNQLIEVELQAIYKDAPAFENKKASVNQTKCNLKMVKIQDNLKIATLPDTSAKVLFYGEISLQSPVQKYGVLIDFEAKEKILWVDSDGDKDFKEESGYEIFKSDRYPGLNIYYSPTPISLTVKYFLDGQLSEKTLQFDIPYILITKFGSGDYFQVKSRTWFSGLIKLDGEELQVALVDVDDNGSYTDPKDLLFLDQDFDLIFSQKEGKYIEKLRTIRLKSRRKISFNLKKAPEKLVVIIED